jgi:DNA-binding transcriptional regulator/RsmH inhibitor MraZ
VVAVSLAGISREALDDHFGTDMLDAKGRVAVVRQRRSEIEAMAALKYANWQIEDLEITLIKTADVEQLRHDLANRNRITTRNPK